MSFLDKEGLISYDSKTKENQGYWRKGQTVAVGDVRYVTGKDNAGYVLECIEAGTTGTTQPTVVSSDNGQYVAIMPTVASTLEQIRFTSNENVNFTAADWSLSGGKYYLDTECDGVNEVFVKDGLKYKKTFCPIHIDEDGYSVIVSDDAFEGFFVKPRSVNLVSDRNGNDIVDTYLRKEELSRVLNLMFDTDVNGDLMPGASPVGTKDWDLDANLDIMPTA